MMQNNSEKRSDEVDSVTPLTVNSKSLFGNNKEVLILHEGKIYKLKITRFGKLILNK